MTSEYTNYQCPMCGVEFAAGVVHVCPKWLPLTEARVREIAREEILRAVETHDADAEIRRQARNEALEEAALMHEAQCCPNAAEEVRSLKSKPAAPAQPSAEKPPPELCVWMTAKRRDECLGFEKERDDLYEKLAAANRDRNCLLQRLKDEQRKTISAPVRLS